MCICLRVRWVLTLLVRKIVNQSNVRWDGMKPIGGIGGSNDGANNADDREGIMQPNPPPSESSNSECQQPVDDTVSFMGPNDDGAQEREWRALYENKIDNSQLTYVAINLRCGVKLMCRPDVLTCCRSVLYDIREDLSQCFEIFPSSVHALIRRTRIWVNLSFLYGPRDNLRILRHSTAHHHEAWLLWCVQYAKTILLDESVTYY